MSRTIKKIEDILKIQTKRTILIRIDEVCLHPQQSKVKVVRGCVMVVMYDDELYFMWLPYALLINIDSNLCVYLRKDNSLVTEREFQHHVRAKTSRRKESEKKTISPDQKSSGQVTTPTRKYISSQVSIPSVESPSQLLDKNEGEFVSIQFRTPTKNVFEVNKLKNTGFDEKFYSNEQLFALCFQMKDINSMKRYLPEIGWSHLIVTLNNAISQSPLHFHDGGMNYFFQELRKHVTLQRTSIDPDLFIINSVQSPLKTSLREIGFDTYFEDVYQPKWNFLEIGSTITKTARNLKNQFLGSSKKKKVHSNYSFEEKKNVRKLIQSPADDLNEVDDFVLIESDDTRAQKSIIEKWGKQHERVVTRKKWETVYLDKESGKVKNFEKLKEDVFFGGIAEMELRKVIWPFLLGFFDANSTYKEREELLLKKRKEYEILKTQWTSVSEEQKSQFQIFRSREVKIEKDVVRTDRNFEDYVDEKSKWLVILNDILMSYNYYNFDLGYCQGMNDLISPILTIMRDEALSFWCFVHLMKKVGKNFMKDSENGIDKQLKQLGHVIRNLDISFYNYLEDVGAAPDLFFCFRWLLVMFKREFPFLVIVRLWESIFTEKLELKTPVENGFNATIFIAYGMLHNILKGEILEKKLRGDEIFKFVIDKQMNFDVIQALKDGECAFELYKRHLEKSKSENGGDTFH